MGLKIIYNLSCFLMVLSSEVLITKNVRIICAMFGMNKHIGVGNRFEKESLVSLATMSLLYHMAKLIIPHRNVIQTHINAVGSPIFFQKIYL